MEDKIYGNVSKDKILKVLDVVKTNLEENKKSEKYHISREEIKNHF